MKKISLYIAALCTILACEEEGPFINFEEEQNTLVDTSYISNSPIQQVNKNVLFEEFSGVRCSNCPIGNVATHDLYVANGNRFVPVTVHSDFLAFPYSGSQDLRVPEADELAISLGPVSQKPSAFINRKTLGGNRLQTSLGSWASTVDDILTETSFVDIELDIVDVNTTERTFRYRVTLSYNAAAPSHNLGFYLTESEIIAKQLDGNTQITDYEHEFVLRKALTPIIGSPIQENVLANTVIIKEFEQDLDDFDIDNIWVINHMHLVAFVRLENDNIETAAMVNLVD